MELMLLESRDWQMDISKEDVFPIVRSATHKASLAHFLDCTDDMTEGRSLEPSTLIRESICQYKKAFWFYSGFPNTRDNGFLGYLTTEAV
jgi:hypothetical protein